MMLSPVFIVARPLGRHPSMHMHQSTPVVRPQIACEASGSDQASNSERGFGKVRDQSEKAPGGHRTAGRDGSGKGGRGGSGGRVSRPAKDSASGPGQAPSKVGANRASRRAAERAEAAAADGASVASSGGSGAFGGVSVGATAEAWAATSSDAIRSQMHTAETVRPSGRGGRGDRKGSALGHSRSAEGLGAARLVAHQQTKTPREVTIGFHSGHRLHARLAGDHLSGRQHCISGADSHPRRSGRAQALSDQCQLLHS